MSPIAVVLPSKIFNMVFTSAPGSLQLPLTDYQLLARQGIDFGILPMAMFFAGKLNCTFETPISQFLST